MNACHRHGTDAATFILVGYLPEKYPVRVRTDSFPLPAGGTTSTRSARKVLSLGFAGEYARVYWSRISRATSVQIPSTSCNPSGKYADPPVACVSDISTWRARSAESFFSWLSR